MSDSLRPHGPQHTRPPCPSPTPRACSNSCPSSQWCHWSVSSSVIPFSSCLQSFPTSGSFPMSQFFASGGQSIWSFKNYLKKSSSGNSLVGQWLKLHTHHRGHGFDPWLGRKDPTRHTVESQKKKKKSSSKYPTLLYQPNPHDLAWAISSWHSVSKQHWLPPLVLKIYVLNTTLIKQNLSLQRGLRGQEIQELSSFRTNATLLRFEAVFKRGHQGALKWFCSTPVGEGNQNEVSRCLSSCGQLCALSCEPLELQFEAFFVYFLCIGFFSAGANQWRET